MPIFVLIISSLSTSFPSPSFSPFVVLCVMTLLDLQPSSFDFLDRTSICTRCFILPPSRARLLPPPIHPLSFPDPGSDPFILSHYKFVVFLGMWTIPILFIVRMETSFSVPPLILIVGARLLSSLPVSDSLTLWNLIYCFALAFYSFNPRLLAPFTYILPRSVNIRSISPHRLLPSFLLPTAFHLHCHCTSCLIHRPLLYFCILFTIFHAAYTAMHIYTIYACHVDVIPHGARSGHLRVYSSHSATHRMYCPIAHGPRSRNSENISIYHEVRPFDSGGAIIQNPKDHFFLLWSSLYDPCSAQNNARYVHNLVPRRRISDKHPAPVGFNLRRKIAT
ncbi:hypothetical protein DFH06DRAFT_110708 [Mycena polygramma]|nr:hypothetical protein DFH06DRAFT_110708 [Mycena polygramma]